MCMVLFLNLNNTVYYDYTYLSLVNSSFLLLFSVSLFLFRGSALGALCWLFLYRRRRRGHSCCQLILLLFLYPGHPRLILRHCQDATTHCHEQLSPCSGWSPGLGFGEILVIHMRYWARWHLHERLVTPLMTGVPSGVLNWTRIRPGRMKSRGWRLRDCQSK